MTERYIEQVHTEHAVLDIGGNIGALIIHTGEELRGKEIEVSRNDNPSRRVHTDVLERRFNSRTVFAALFIGLEAGEYTIWKNDLETAGTITIVGGEVAEVSWR